MLNKEIAILALFGLITKTQAVQCAAGEACPGVQQCAADKMKLLQFRYFTHSNAAVKKLMSSWWDKNKPAPPKPDESDDEDQDDEDNNDNSLPFLTQTTYSTKDCGTPLRRLLAEGGSRIKVPEGNKFDDVSFPAGSDSIEWAKNRNDKWARVTERQTKPSLYGSKGIQEGAVKQGRLGDCWLLACVAALGEVPDRVEKLMNGQKSWPQDGQFTLNFYAYGKVQKVTIDDKLPFTRGSNTKFTHKSNSGAWWATIAEKASAKFYGNYQIMSGGYMDAGMTVLTGMPSIQPSIRSASGNKQKSDELFAKIQAWDQAGFIMTGAVHSPKNSYGLPKGHAYTILGAQMLGTKKVLRIRNPWGKERYTGSMCDSKLTAADLKELKHVKSNDGIYFMPLDEFTSAFTGLVITYYDSWKMNDYQTSWDRKVDMRTLSYQIDNPADQRAMIGMAGAQNRMFNSVKGCKDRHMIEDTVFNLYNSRGQQMKDSNGAGGMWFSKTNANSALYFDKLPKGAYKLKITRNAKKSNIGAMPFAVTTFAMDKEISVNA